MKLIKRINPFAALFTKIAVEKTTVDYQLHLYEEISERDLFIGHTIEKNSLAVVDDGRLMNKGSLIVGAGGSGRLRASMGQLYYHFKQGSGGLMLYSTPDTYLEQLTGDILDVLDRKKDLVVFKLNHYLPEFNNPVIADIKSIDFDKLVSKKKILFIDGTFQNEELERFIIKSYFESLTKHYIHHKLKNVSTYSMSPFICLDDINSIEPLYLKDELLRLRMLVGLYPMLTYCSLMNSIKRYQDDAYSLFFAMDYKYFMKMHDPEEAEQIIAKFRLDKLGGINIRDLFGSGPGQALFQHGADIKHIAMAYLDPR